MVDPGNGGAANGLSDNENDHETIIFTTDTLPEARGTVATEIAKTAKEVQMTQAVNLFTFLRNDSSSLLELNADASAYTFLVHIPGSSKVKLCYGLGVGASGLGQTSPLDGNFVSLAGDGGGIMGTPIPFVFPTTARTSQQMKVMKHSQFSTSLTTKGNNYSWPLLPNAQVDTQASLMKLAPIPSFLVYDGVQNQLDAADIYERVLHQEKTDENKDMLQHLRRFLRSCLQSHPKNSSTPSLDLEIFAAAPTTEARTWANNKFKSMFPGLAPQPPQAGDLNLGAGNVTAELLAQIIARLPQQQAPTHAAATEEKKDDSSSLNISEKEKSQLFTMCGLPEDSSDDMLPSWVQETHEKNMTDTFKLQIIRDSISSRTYYDDADVPLTSVLLKMVAKRSWAGKEGNIKKPSLTHAMEGLSPFACAALDDDEVARINSHDELIDNATSVTVSDLAKVKKQLKAAVPTTASDFVDMLKAYANLLFALFTSHCPLFRALRTVIDALKEFSKQARDALCTASKASILWIILLQSRRFSTGDMSLLCEFTTMQSDLCGKKNFIRHAEVPDALLNPNTAKDSNKRPAPGDSADTPGETAPPTKKATRNLNCWHPKLRAALAGPLAKADSPSISAIAKYCGFDLADVFDVDKKRCTSNSILGRCQRGHACERKHSLPTEAEVEKILKLVEKFISDPLGAKKGQ